jgi:hypothetical protein
MIGYPVRVEVIRKLERKLTHDDGVDLFWLVVIFLTVDWPRLYA